MGSTGNFVAGILLSEKRQRGLGRRRDSRISRNNQHWNVGCDQRRNTQPTRVATLDTKLFQGKEWGEKRTIDSTRCSRPLSDEQDAD
jgi:hypothetical protein